MAFSTTCELNNDGKVHNVLSCKYKLNRDVDSKGRPSSNIYGGKVTISLESTDDTSILEQMVNQFKPFAGKITFHRGDEESKMKELTWENGYVIDFEESIDTIGSTPMSLTFTVSAKTLKIGGAQIDQDWPSVAQ